MRPWWIESVKTIDEVNNSFNNISIEYPESIFCDKTIHYENFQSDYDSQKLCRIVDAMNNRHIIDRNILCPWGCSTSFHERGSVPFDIMIQKILPKIILITYTDKAKHRFVQSSWNQYFQINNDYPKILLNNEWVVQPSIVLDLSGLLLLTCKYHNGGEDKQYFFTPKSPKRDILNAAQSDQLAPCVKVPRISKPTKAMKYCTKFSMVQCWSSYHGIDTMNISKHSDFSKCSELLSQHEDATIIGRPDINMLLHQKVSAKQITPELCESYIENAKRRYNLSQLRKYTQGSTYVSFRDMIDLYLYETSDKKDIRIIDDDPDTRSQEVFVRRTWQPIINMLQTEDEYGYGTHFRPVPQFNTNNVPSAFTWVLFSLISSSKELWRLIDQKPNPYRWSSWEGWLLSSVQYFCFQNYPILRDKRNSIKKLTKMSEIAEK